MFLGFIALEDTLSGMMDTTNGDFLVLTPTAVPTYRIYGPNATAVMTGGTGSTAGPIDSQTGLYQFGHEILSSQGYEAGKTYTIRFTYASAGNSYCKTYTFSVV